MRSFDFFRRPNVRSAGLAFAVAGSSLLAGCDGFLDQLQADNMAVAVLTQTPSFDDPTHPGTPLPEAAAFTLNFSKVDKTQLTGGSPSASAISGNPGAAVKLLFKDTDTNQDVSINLTTDKDGNCTTSSKDSKLKVRQTSYTLQIDYEGKTYKMTVTPPAPTKIKEFEDSKLVADHDAGAPFVVTRSPATTDIAIVNVVAKNGDGATSAYTNLPKDALGLVQFALADDAWRKPSFEIPGATFAASNQYIVSMSTMAKGEQSTGSDTSALFSASSFLAGTSDGGIVATK